jgi:GcrA cell cycle regulator
MSNPDIVARDAEICREYRQEGSAMAKIGKAHGISRQRVQQVLIQNGHVPNPCCRGVPWSSDELEWLADRWGIGWTTGRIARGLGRSRNSVIGKARRMKLRPRPSPIIRAGQSGQAAAMSAK